MKVLLIGGGGREHALLWKLNQSPSVTELYCCPGNAGTASIAENLPLSLSHIPALALWAVEHGIDLCVVGPEAPLAEGLVDVFRGHGLRVFGPTREAAKIESSKAFSKELMLKAGVATPKGEVFDDIKKAKDYGCAGPFPLVVKADGLAAGKGVVIAHNADEFLRTVEDFMLGGRHGEAGKRVVV